MMFSLILKKDAVFVKAIIRIILSSKLLVTFDSLERYCSEISFRLRTTDITYNIV